MLAGSGPHRPAAAALSALSALVFLGRRWQPAGRHAWPPSPRSPSWSPSCRGRPSRSSSAPSSTFALAGAINREREAVVAWFAGAGLLAYAAWVDPLGGGAGDFVLSLAFGTMLWAAGLLVARRSRSADGRRASRRAGRAGPRRAGPPRRRGGARPHRPRAARRRQPRPVRRRPADPGARGPPSEDGGDGRRPAPDAVEETAREALGEMRRMLGLLQVDDLTARPSRTRRRRAPRRCPPWSTAPPPPGCASPRTSRPTPTCRRGARARRLPRRAGGADQRGQARARARAVRGRRPRRATARPW